ncbi:MAG: DoxX family membrane protein [Pseudolabrys sp.]|nr:DoxX family membrane protein [Pseudolabrys sp.]MBV9955794.1 DoxX family membrane protein [Pseudolabrys sp.]
MQIARPSPAVAAALARSTTAAAKIAKSHPVAHSVAGRARTWRRRSLPVLVVDGFISACATIPYSVVALALRVLMAQLFFIAGQTMISGPRIPIEFQDLFRTSLVLPFEVRASTFDMFMTQYAALPLPPVVAAYMASYAAFVLPVLLVLGLATRAAAIGLLVMTAMIYLVMPSALLTALIFWAAILLVLISQGPGVFSLDHVIAKLMRH